MDAKSWFYSQSFNGRLPEQAEDRQPPEVKEDVSGLFEMLAVLRPNVQGYIPVPKHECGEEFSPGIRCNRRLGHEGQHRWMEEE